MSRLISNRGLITVNFVIVSYFILIWLINFYKIDFVLIGVVREILTIPFLIAQIVFLAIGIKYLITNKRNFFTLLSVLALAICSIITIRSFFWNRLLATSFQKISLKRIHNIQYISLIGHKRKNTAIGGNCPVWLPKQGFPQ